MYKRTTTSTTNPNFKEAVGDLVASCGNVEARFDREEWLESNHISGSATLIFILLQTRSFPAAL